MHTLNYLVTQSREQEIARAASHPSRLMAHDLRLDRRYNRRRREAATSAREPTSGDTGTAAPAWPRRARVTWCPGPGPCFPPSWPSRRWH